MFCSKLSQDRQTNGQTDRQTDGCPFNVHCPSDKMMMVRQLQRHLKKCTKLKVTLTKKMVQSSKEDFIQFVTGKRKEKLQRKNKIKKIVEKPERNL